MTTRSKWELAIGGLIVASMLGLMLVAIFNINLQYVLAVGAPMPTSVSPLPAITVAPGSETDALLQAVETQQAQIDTLTRDLKNVKEDQQRDLIDVRWLLDSKLVLAGALLSIASLLGVGAYANIGQKVKERVQAELDHAVMGMDPAYVPVFLPEDQAALYDRLEYAGLKALSEYPPDALMARPGITIVAVTNPDQEKAFLEFLEKSHQEVNPRRSAFILYTPGYRVDTLGHLFALHDNLVTANMPSTVISAVFNVGRGLMSVRKRSTAGKPEGADF